MTGVQTCALPICEEERHSRRMEEIVEKTKGIAEEWKMKAVLMATRYEDGDWFEKTKGYYQKALEVDRDVEHIFAYAYFLQEHNQYQEATPLYTEALETYRSIAKSNPSAFLPDVATTLNNLAILHHAKNELEQADGEYGEALEIYRSLAKSNPLAFLPYVAAILNNLAVLHRDKNELEQPEGEYGEALEIRRSLAKSNPSAFLPDVAMTLNNLANLHRAKNESEQAEEEYGEALEIYRSIVKSNPSAFLPYVANTASNLAVFYQDYQPDREQSLAFVKDALKAASPFDSNLKFAQDSIKRAKRVIERWGLDVEEFLKEIDSEEDE